MFSAGDIVKINGSKQFAVVEQLVEDGDSPEESVVSVRVPMHGRPLTRLVDPLTRLVENRQKGTVERKLRAHQLLPVCRKLYTDPADGDVVVAFPLEKPPHLSVAMRSKKATYFRNIWFGETFALQEVQSGVWREVDYKLIHLPVRSTTPVKLGDEVIVVSSELRGRCGVVSHINNYGHIQIVIAPPTNLANRFDLKEWTETFSIGEISLLAPPPEPLKGLPVVEQDEIVVPVPRFAHVQWIDIEEVLV